MPSVRIEPNYKVTIPKDARASLGLKVGEEVETLTSKDSITFRKAKTYTPTPRELAAIRKGREEIKKGNFYTLDEFETWLLGSNRQKARAKKSPAPTTPRTRAPHTST
ncbi:MAG: AbrB/MazE/SpoVT family DNA-binding domain-containing protein [Deltaproteobacteria bacterium]|nr:AbrB/MazE/SpoVT family DNA-binding domain-containing protein [Deltaproteobacteria bacterium]